jgi:hypothetical protein
MKGVKSPKENNLSESSSDLQEINIYSSFMESMENSIFDDNNNIS